jgi:hypothetical protein
MPYVAGTGRYARETYPERPSGSAAGPPGPTGANGTPGPTGPAGPTLVGGTAQVTADVDNLFELNGVSLQWVQVTGSAFSYAGTTDFTLTPGSCVLTYNGPSGRSFLVLYTCSAEAQGGAVNGTSGFAIDHNNDLVGNAMFSNAASAAGSMYVDLITGGAITGTVQRRVTLNNGDTLKPLASKFTGDADWDIHSLSFTVIPQ